MLREKTRFEKTGFFMRGFARLLKKTATAVDFMLRYHVLVNVYTLAGFRSLDGGGFRYRPAMEGN